jgi:hypothetical protein
MSNHALRLKRLWVDWCEHNRPATEDTPWPAEAFLRWAAHELRTEVVALLGDDAQCTLLRELAPHVQEHWPVPTDEHEHPTNPENTKPSTFPPVDGEELFGADARALGTLLPFPRTLPRLQHTADDRSDLTAQGEVKAKTFLDLLYLPRDFFRATWFELKAEPFAGCEALYVTSIMVGLEEQLLEPCPLVLFTGRQNEGLINMKSAAPGTRIRVQLRNDSTHNFAVELRLHGVEPVKESETA